MKKASVFVAIAMAVCLASMAQAAALKPLTEVVKTPVGNVASGGETIVPIITWGGDALTIFANGNARSTVKGSIFDKEGLQIKLVREDDFTKQLSMYLSGKTPYLRGTMGMINQALELISVDQRTVPTVIFQHTWSSGGDVFVGKESIKTPADLRGKTIALQAYGPHVDYLGVVLADAGLSLKDVNIVWTKDLTGDGDTPAKALRTNSAVDAAFVISPDALALTSGGKVGSGAEDSVRGAHTVLSTKTANRVIADVYVVRADYFAQNRTKVQAFVHGLMLGQEALVESLKQKATAKQTLTALGDILLDNAQDTAGAEGLLGDCEFVGYRGNVAFFGDPNNTRNFEILTTEIQTSFIPIGILSKRIALAHAKWDYNALKTGLVDVSGVEAPRFDTNAVAQVVTRMQQQGTLDSGELFSFEIYFEPNQQQFSAELYHDAFEKVVKLAARYGGAVITVEGHSDPLNYLRRKKDGATDIELRQIRQAAKNLGIARSNAVRDTIVEFAKSQRISLDPSQFTALGQGIEQPKNGLCGQDPCAPRTEQEWRNNMRVVFRIIQIEAETSAFKPL